MGIESDLNRPLLESTGWLAAHRRKKTALGGNAITSRQSSLTGRVCRPDPTANPLFGWRSWSMQLFNELDVVGEDDVGLHDA